MSSGTQVRGKKRRFVKSRDRKAKRGQKIAVMNVIAKQILALPNQGKSRRDRASGWKDKIQFYDELVDLWSAAQGERGANKKSQKLLLDFIWIQIRAGKNVRACMEALKYCPANS